MKRTSIYLAENQAAVLDRVARAASVSRAELIRTLIDRAIGGHAGADLAADLAAIDCLLRRPRRAGGLLPGTGRPF